MVQGLRTLTALPQDPGSIQLPSVTTVLSNSTLSWPRQAQRTMCDAQTHMHTKHPDT